MVTSKFFNEFSDVRTESKILFRGRHRRCSLRKCLLRNFAKFTEKHLRQSLFFNKSCLWPATLLKKRLWRRCFSVDFAKFLRTPFLQTPLADCFCFLLYEKIQVKENPYSTILYAVRFKYPLKFFYSKIFFHCRSKSRTLTNIWTFLRK